MKDKIRNSYSGIFTVGIVLFCLLFTSILYAGKCDTPPPLDADQWKKLRNGDVLLKKLKTKKDTFAYLAHILIPTEPKHVMAYLHDFDEIRRNTPNLEKFTYSCDGDVCRLTGNLDMKVRDATNTVEYHFVNECLVTTKLLKGELSDVTAHYKLFSVDDGASTLLERKIYMHPDVGIPVWMISKGTKKSLPKVLKNMRTRVLKRTDAK